MDLTQLFAEHGVTHADLDPAPAAVMRRHASARIRRLPPWPCRLCGQPSPAAFVAVTAAAGPRWVELCGQHAVQAGRLGRPWYAHR
jgi:hypothetical protein